MVYDVGVTTENPHLAILHPDAGWLVGKNANVTSQFGEDGLIEAVFERIGETNRWCFEVGAADGLFFSNTKRLRDAAWRAVLIEADPVQYEKLRQLEDAYTQTFHHRISRKSLDSILSDAAAPISPDLGVIDIDGQDYWAWLGMEMYRPRVMLVEFMYLNDHFTDESFVPVEGGEGQAGRQAIIDLGISKRYLPLANTYCNLLFVAEECWK